MISLPVACFASAMYIVQSLGRLTLTVATVLGHVTAFYNGVCDSTCLSLLLIRIQ